MKKSLFTLTIVASLLLGFNNCQAKTESNKSANPAESVASEDHATVKLTKALFLEKVWDYENSPQEWKYKGAKPA